MIIAIILAIFAGVAGAITIIYATHHTKKLREEGREKELEKERKRGGLIGGIICTVAISVFAIISFVIFL